MSDQYTELDRLTILSLLEQGEHGAAYQPVANELTPGTSLHTWFTNAALINANGGSASVFARIQTYGAYTVSFDFERMRDTDLQDVSDDIAVKVLNDFVNSKGTNITLEDIVERERETVGGKYGVPMYLSTLSNPVTSVKMKKNFSLVEANGIVGWFQLGFTTAISGGAAFLNEGIGSGALSPLHALARFSVDLDYQTSNRFAATTNAQIASTQQKVWDDHVGNDPGAVPILTGPTRTGSDLSPARGDDLDGSGGYTVPRGYGSARVPDDPNGYGPTVRMDRIRPGDEYNALDEIAHAQALRKNFSGSSSGDSGNGGYNGGPWPTHTPPGSYGSGLQGVRDRPDRSDSPSPPPSRSVRPDAPDPSSGGAGFVHGSGGRNNGGGYSSNTYPPDA